MRRADRRPSRRARDFFERCRASAGRPARTLRARCSRRALLRAPDERACARSSSVDVPDVRDRRHVARGRRPRLAPPAVASRSSSRPSPVSADSLRRRLTVLDGQAAGRSLLFATTTRGTSTFASSSARSSGVERPRPIEHDDDDARRSAAAAARARCLLLRSRRLASRTPAVSTSVTGTPSMSTPRSQIARRPGHVGHDRAARADERVEQARLAGVRPARRARPCSPRGQARPRARVSSSASTRDADRRDLAGAALPARRSESPRRESRATPRGAPIRSNSAASIAAMSRRQRAFELIEGGRACSGVTASIEIRDRLRLHEIDPLVEDTRAA